MKINRTTINHFWLCCKVRYSGCGSRMDSTKRDDFICVTNRTQLNFNHMRNREDLSDINLRCDRREFRVHRFLLAACSPYFKSLFERRANTKLNIVLSNVNGYDMDHVLTYMYAGRVNIKDADIQGFCELLELFLMPLPDGIDVVDEIDPKKEKADRKRRAQPESNDDEYYEFVKCMRNRLESLNKDNLETQASELLDMIELIEEMDILLDLILRSVIQPKFNPVNHLIVPLVKYICDQDPNECDDTLYFRETLRVKSLKLFLRVNKSLVQHQVVVLPNVTNSLDLQVNLMESVDMYCAPLRLQRLAHFIGHLVQMDIVSREELKDFIDQNTFLEEILGEKHEDENCCDFELNPLARKILDDKWYASEHITYDSIKSTENHIFWCRNELVLGSNSSGISYIKKPNKPRKRNKDKKKKKKHKSIKAKK
ncbi:uncharacterized protein LOC116340190 [Contarinia nasturtii]|uniref:uncharacterized protein LOC116340190 n=1 Tax=Contarinia nasturtii TaxID=265458 RepID=UPI0012D46999|nr:uncharacterized protein LOC116340190 [Contarinia nasturtii]